MKTIKCRTMVFMVLLVLVTLLCASTPALSAAQSSYYAQYSGECHIYQERDSDGIYYYYDNVRRSDFDGYLTYMKSQGYTVMSINTDAGEELYFLTDTDTGYVYGVAYSDEMEVMADYMFSDEEEVVIHNGTDIPTIEQLGGEYCRATIDDIDIEFQFDGTHNGRKENIVIIADTYDTLGRKKERIYISFLPIEAGDNWTTEKSRKHKCLNCICLYEYYAGKTTDEWYSSTGSYGGFESSFIYRDGMDLNISVDSITKCIAIFNKHSPSAMYEKEGYFITGTFSGVMLNGNRKKYVENGEFGVWWRGN